jgi:hypothetical protein
MLLPAWYMQFKKFKVNIVSILLSSECEEFPIFAVFDVLHVQGLNTHKRLPSKLFITIILGASELPNLNAMHI